MLQDGSASRDCEYIGFGSVEPAAADTSGEPTEQPHQGQQCPGDQIGPTSAVRRSAQLRVTCTIEKLMEGHAGPFHFLMPGMFVHPRDHLAVASLQAATASLMWS